MGRNDIKRNDGTRGALIAAAEELFRINGYDRTSVNEIAEKAGKVKGSLYYHFPSKTSLYNAVLDAELERVASVLEPVLHDGGRSEVDRIESYIVGRMELLKDASAYHIFLKREISGESFDGEMTLVLERHCRKERTELERLIRAGVEKGIFSSGIHMEILLDMFQVLLKGLDVQFFVNGRYEDYKDTFRLMVSFFSHGLV